MQIGNMKVFPRANKVPRTCCVCSAVIPIKTGFTHNYKCYIPFDEAVTKIKPYKPTGYRQTYTRQLHFCSESCVVMRGLNGVYYDD